jgi:3-hydroxyanthranilate 3,4-dioxygenase
MLPARVPHSPQRYENSVGLVIEHKRAPEMEDGFQWYCPKCHDLLYQKFIHVHDIVQQLPEVFNNFYNNDQNSFCDRCQLKVISNV